VNTDRLLRIQDSPPRLLVDVDRSDLTRLRVVLAGELDALGAAELSEVVVDVLRRHRPDHIEINLRAVPFLDSAGIGTLLSCRCAAQLLDCVLTVTDPHPLAHRVLRITGLLDHLGVTGAGVPRSHLGGLKP
jgi:anti-anti-sigma factor